MKTPYDDIIHLPHHVSRNHPQMPMLDRAAQFAPFAALTGYEAAVGETARLTAERRELDAQEAEELNRRLAALIANLPDRPDATIEYFVPDDRKSGGAYVTVTGRVRHISVPEKTLVMEDGTVIGFVLFRQTGSEFRRSCEPDNHHKRRLPGRECRRKCQLHAH